MTPFDPDGSFAMHSLSRLEAAGINIVTLLSRNILQLASCVGVTLDQNDERNLMELSRNRNSSKGLKEVIDLWKSGISNRPVTWRSLLDTLLELNLVETSLQIEEYLSG